jgi:hypothetical protein
MGLLPAFLDHLDEFFVLHDFIERQPEIDIQADALECRALDVGFNFCESAQIFLINKRQGFGRFSV